MRRRSIPLALLIATLAAADPAAAFQVGASPDFPGCNVWFNDQGQPLRNKLGREIGEQVPCPGQTPRHDAYKTVLGDKAGTLLIQDETHNLECLMTLAPGSATVIVPKACRPINR